MIYENDEIEIRPNKDGLYLYLKKEFAEVVLRDDALKAIETHLKESRATSHNSRKLRSYKKVRHH